MIHEETDTIQEADPNKRYVIIAGSREYAYTILVDKFVMNLPKDVVVVTGGARGVDSWATAIATECGLETIVHKADWNKYGRSAGPIRNNLMLSLYPGTLVVFWDGVSRGTKHILSAAKAQGRHIILFFNDNAAYEINAEEEEVDD